MFHCYISMQHTNSHLQKMYKRSFPLSFYYCYGVAHHADFIYSAGRITELENLRRRLRNKKSGEERREREEDKVSGAHADADQLVC
jgi:hypothetical protein